MRQNVDSLLIREFFDRVGRSLRGSHRIYVSGGSTAVLNGWRDSTVDIDIRLDADGPDILDEVVKIKRDLDINIEEASPLDFIPAPPGWEERSRWIGRFGSLDAFDIDPYTQALAKLERNFPTDLADCRAMVRLGLVDPNRLWEVFTQIRPSLGRFMAIDPIEFEHRVRAFVAEHGHDDTH